MKLTKKQKNAGLIIGGLLVLVLFMNYVLFPLMAFGDKIDINHGGTGTLTCYVQAYNDGKAFTIPQGGSKSISLPSAGMITTGKCYCPKAYQTKYVNINTANSFRYNIYLDCEGEEPTVCTPDERQRSNHICSGNYACYDVRVCFADGSGWGKWATTCDNCELQGKICKYGRCENSVTTTTTPTTTIKQTTTTTKYTTTTISGCVSQCSPSVSDQCTMIEGDAYRCRYTSTECLQWVKDETCAGGIPSEAIGIVVFVILIIAGIWYTTKKK